MTTASISDALNEAPLPTDPLMLAKRALAQVGSIKANSSRELHHAAVRAVDAELAARAATEEAREEANRRGGGVVAFIGPSELSQLNRGRTAMVGPAGDPGDTPLYLSDGHDAVRLDALDCPGWTFEIRCSRERFGTGFDAVEKKQYRVNGGKAADSLREAIDLAFDLVHVGATHTPAIPLPGLDEATTELLDAWDDHRKGNTSQRLRDAFKTFRATVTTAPATISKTIYSPVQCSPHAEQDGRHPNDNEERDDDRSQYLTERGDDQGQGLDTYWKWGHAAGWNDHKRHSATSHGPVRSLQPLSEAAYCEALRPLAGEFVASANTTRRIVRALEAALGVEMAPAIEPAATCEAGAQAPAPDAVDEARLAEEMRRIAEWHQGEACHRRKLADDPSSKWVEPPINGKGGHPSVIPGGLRCAADWHDKAAATILASSRDECPNCGHAPMTDHGSLHQAAEPLSLPANIIQAISIYGDARADDGNSGEALGAAIKSIRQWAGSLHQSAEPIPKLTKSQSRGMYQSDLNSYASQHQSAEPAASDMVLVPRVATLVLSERERFEAKFPVPAGVQWIGDGYEVKDTYANSYVCDRYVACWVAWLTAKTDQAGERDKKL